jgi:mannan endo-1,4-beta-mannosidase
MKNLTVQIKKILIFTFIFTGCFTGTGYSISLNDARQYLVDKQATERTAALFFNLKDSMGQGIMFGHHDTTRYGFAGGSWSDSLGDQNRSDVKTATGYFPAVYGYDFIDIPGSLGEMAAHVKKAYGRGGVITISWHAKNPITGGGYSDSTGYPIKEIVPGGSANATYKSWLDQIADFANNLIEVSGVGVPIVFRPFHEHNGSWFWWGAGYCTPDEYKAAWRYTVEYLRDTKGVRNFLYAYSPNGPWSESTIVERYPGDDYVDVIGFDYYGSVYGIVSCSRVVVEFAEPRNKIVAITEFGPHNDGIDDFSDGNFYTNLINELKNDSVAKKIAWCLTWRNAGPTHYWVPVSGDIHYNSFQSFFNDSYTVFENNMGDFYSYSFGSGSDTTPPNAPGAVNDGTGIDIDSTLSTTQLSANWTPSTDPESYVSYKYAIGTSAGSTNIAGWTSNSGTSVTKPGTYTVGQTYYFTVKAVSGGGESAATSSDGQTVEASNNLALGKQVSVSTTQSPHEAANAVDGDTGTRWSGLYADPQWIYIDLGEVYSVDKVILSWETAYGSSYEIQLSMDASSWDPVYSTTSGDGGTDEINFNAEDARYVRMYGTQRATEYGYSLWEFEVYGGGGGGADTTPSVISNVNAGDITMTAATITWDTDEPATSRVEYGPSGYGNSTVEDSNLVTGHSVDLTSLIPGIEYHYRVISKDSSGNEKISIDYTFKTSGPGEDKIDAKAYPNPYSPSKGSSMRFSIDGAGGGEVRIYTISGKLVKKLLIQSGVSEVNWDVLNEEGNSITTGLYLYSITDGEGNKKTGKLGISK